MMDDTEYFYYMSDKINRMHVEKELNEFLELVKTMVRIKAFVTVMRL
jgi:hypothetical protein